MLKRLKLNISMVQALTILSALQLFSEGVPGAEGSGEPYGISRGVVEGAARAGSVLSPHQAQSESDMRPNVPALSQVSPTSAPSSLDPSSNSNSNFNGFGNGPIGTQAQKPEMPSCFGNGVLRFERLPDVKLATTSSDIVNLKQIPADVLFKCQDYCLKDKTQTMAQECGSLDFVPGKIYSSKLEYTESKCFLAMPDETNGKPPEYKRAKDYYHYREVCYKGSDTEQPRVATDCPERLYVMERVMGKRFIPKGAREVEANDLEDCQSKCLNQETDHPLMATSICRAGSFDHRSGRCYLSTFTRRTHPEEFHDELIFDYFENTCLDVERRCPKDRLFWMIEINTEMIGPYDFLLHQNITMQECQSKCLQNANIFCRSIEYDERSKTCVLSDEDTTTRRADIRQSLSDQNIYMELNCLDGEDVHPENALRLSDSTNPANRDRQPLSDRNLRDVQTAFQLFRDRVLDPNSLTTELNRVGEQVSLAKCLDACLEETSFSCRSVAYSSALKRCRLSESDRGAGQLVLNREYDYFENLMSASRADTFLGSRPDNFDNKPGRFRPFNNVDSQFRGGGGGSGFNNFDNRDQFLRPNTGGGVSGSRGGVSDNRGGFRSGGSSFGSSGSSFDNRVNRFGANEDRFSNVFNKFSAESLNRDREANRAAFGTSGSRGGSTNVRLGSFGSRGGSTNVRLGSSGSRGGSTNDRFGTRITGFGGFTGQRQGAGGRFGDSSSTFGSTSGGFGSSGSGGFFGSSSRGGSIDPPRTGSFGSIGGGTFGSRGTGNRGTGVNRFAGGTGSSIGFSSGADIGSLNAGGGGGFGGSSFTGSDRFVSGGSFGDSGSSFGFGASSGGSSFGSSSFDGDRFGNRPVFGSAAGNAIVDDQFEVSQQCNPDGSMEFMLRTIEQFRGRVYTFGFYDKCFYRGGGSTVNVLQISPPRGFPECGTSRYGDTTTNIVVVQFADGVMTLRDKKYNLTCTMLEAGDTVVTSAYIGAGLGVPIPIEYIPEVSTLDSQVRLQILYSGRPTTTVAVGDPLTFRIESLTGRSGLPTNIFATDVIAKDLLTDRAVELIDSRGCPVQEEIFPALGRARSGDGLETRFSAFKIPESNMLVFQARVRMCRRDCEPARCNVGRGREEVYSYGKRRRRRETQPDAEFEPVLDKNETSSPPPVSRDYEEEYREEMEEEEEMEERMRRMEEEMEKEEKEKFDGEEAQLNEVIRVYLNEDEASEHRTVEAAELTSGVCVSPSEYYSLLAGLMVACLCLLALLIVFAFCYRRHRNLSHKNAAADDSNPRHHAPSRSVFPGPHARTVNQPARYFPSSDDKGHSTCDLGGRPSSALNRFSDPSEPIYTDPTLFERSPKENGTSSEKL